MIALTNEEKIRLLNGVGSWHTSDCNGKLPSIMMTDGPHGLRKEISYGKLMNNDTAIATCFPTASAIACSWNVNSIAQMAAAIAKEAISENVAMVLGPGVNIKRSPLCGRNFEYFSEDPFLSGILAIAYINALQAEGIGCSLKHFAGNNQETHRQTANSQIDERALYEIYLKAFEMAVTAANPASVMASYNRINGEYAVESHKLLTEILRNQWGFKGSVISDWGAVTNPIKSIEAGLDLEMPDTTSLHTKRLMDALKDGVVNEEAVNRAAQNVSNMVTTLSSAIKNNPGDKTTLLKEHHKLACDLECESAVLLKNDGFFPLSVPRKIVVIGEMARTLRYQGGGSSHIHTAPVMNAIENLSFCGYDVAFAPGYRIDTAKSDKTLEKEALLLAQKQIPILFFGGLPEQFEGEGYDRTTLSMPNNQVALFHKLVSINTNIAFISFSGSAITIPFASSARAILHMYLGGQAVGSAVAKIVSGEVNPSGKLTETFPLRIEDVPSYRYFGQNSDDVEYRESLFVGYRFYKTYHKNVQFPFGHGLSYTTFSYENLVLDKNMLYLPDMRNETPHKDTLEKSMETIFLSCDITNTGSIEGKEIVELYIENPTGKFLRPQMELKGFCKLNLKPGETKKAEFTLDASAFEIYDEQSHCFVVPSGEYKVLIAASSEDIRLSAPISITACDYSKDDTKMLSDYFKTGFDTFEISQSQFKALYGKPLSHFDERKRGDYDVTCSLNQLRKHSLLAGIVLLAGKIMARHTFRGKSLKDPEAQMFLCGMKEGTLESCMCQSGGMIPYKFAEAIVLSANGHPFLALKKML